MAKIHLMKDGDNYDLLEPLTPRETDILRLIATGLSNREIAEELVISLGTVKWYNKQIFGKLGVHNRTSAIARAQTLGILAAFEAPSQVASPTKMLKLPAQLTPLIGREAELDEVAKLLAAPDCRLLTLSGPGGIGKTRLALQATFENAQHFSGGVAFMPLARISTTANVLSTIADTLDYRFYEGSDPKEQLLDYFREKSMLLVFDNFEHLLEAADLIIDILAATSGMKILVTSRETLNLQGEWVRPLDALSIPKDGRAEDSGAVRLFADRARRVDPAFSLQDQQTHVIDICRLVDGIPLAIEIAAAWLPLLSCAEIAAEIRRSRDFLETNARNIPERHRSMRAVFDHSWNLLSEEERATFSSLSVFQGGFDKTAAQAIADAPLSSLSTLASKSLLYRLSDGRYEIHELLRQYAAERLAETPSQSTSIHKRHSTYYAQFVGEREEALRGSHQESALHDIENEIENIRAAWKLAIERVDLTATELFLEGLYHFYDIRSWVQEAEASFADAAQCLHTENPVGQHEILYAKVLAKQGHFAARLSNYGQAAALLQASLAIFHRLGIREETAFSLNNLADVARTAGNYLEARQLCEESLAIFTELDDQSGMAATLNNLGVSAYFLEEYAEAEQLYERSLELSRALGDRYGSATAYMNLGVVAHDLRDYTQAETLYRESLALAEELNDRYGMAATFINLGRVLYARDAHDEALECCQTGLELSRQLGTRYGVAASLINLGDITLELGDSAAARQHLREAYRLAQKIQAIPLITELLISMAALLKREGDNSRAAGLLMAALEQPVLDKENRDRAAELLGDLKNSLTENNIRRITVNIKNLTAQEMAAELFAD